MKTNYLFPNRLKFISGVLFVTSSLMLTLYYSVSQFGQFEFKAKVFAIYGNDGFLGESGWFWGVDNSILDEILMSIVITTGVVFAFCKEKHEDELVASIRLRSLAWATILNYSILLFCYLFIYGMPFLNVLNVAMFSQLLIFILLFRYKMYRFYKSAAYEE
ncbi:hypothetical protein CHU92_05600 [Flavobacterium cyanobacteriorum]|uniref:Uncharacterized protein n=1 Tax=Flavobacterium cyanobacteriorum TaxID=2022802 RepID=A0A255Z9R9_9FLAO|nr:hypothetical protein [Flavobacterium cyanobacteriorum]OYQ38307.1 hypothetical protein CHU92_05600 [Flavobacterium cyanobacteriorum]